MLRTDYISTVGVLVLYNYSTRIDSATATPACTAVVCSLAPRPVSALRTVFTLLFIEAFFFKFHVPVGFGVNVF